MPQRGRGFRIVFLVCLFLLSEFCIADEEVFFSNSWAVEVAGGVVAANEIARKHGFINKGQVSKIRAERLLLPPSN